MYYSWQEMLVYHKPIQPGVVLMGGGSWRGHKSLPPPPVPPNEGHHANILTEIYAITSLGLQVQVCQQSTVTHLPPRPLHCPHSGIPKTAPAFNNCL